MTSNTRSSSRNKDDVSNGLKKKLANGTGSPSSGSKTSDTYDLRRSARDLSSNNQMPKSPASTRKSERLVQSTSVSPVSNWKSGRIGNQLTPSPLRRSERGSKQISSGSSGSKKSEKTSVAVDVDQMMAKGVKNLNELTSEVKVNNSKDKKPASGEKQLLNGRTFKALFKKQRRHKTATDGNGINSFKSDDIVEETLTNAEKLHVHHSREEQLENVEVTDSALIGKSHNYDDIDIACGHSATLLKRKRDPIVDLDAGNDVCTSSSNDLHSSSSYKRHKIFETCAVCSKRQRVDHDTHGQGFCSCSTMLSKDSQETNIIEDMGQLEASTPTEFAEKCDSRAQSKEIPLDIPTKATESSCVICKHGGELILCDGNDCKTRCDLSCYCIRCLNSKMQDGSCSLSKGVEAIWNAREVENSNTEGLGKDQQYFVKYRGLAHIHNQWILESQLLIEAGELIEEFNKNREVVKWNEEWVVPQRLLKKRLLSSPKQFENFAAGTSSSYCEWLVKWRGLDYGSVTWEVDSILNSAYGQNLIKEFENRHKKALGDLSSVNMDKNGSLVKLQNLPAGSPPGWGTSHLDTLNKLLEFRHTGQSSVVFDDQDRILMTLFYIVSLSDVCHPFLIVTTSGLLPVWEAEFLRLAPSVDVVVYDGSSDNRKCIRTLEFYDEGGRIMLQVLLSSVEAVIEDLLFLESMKWKVVIVDDCQQPKISSQFEQLKKLVNGVKILLYRGPLKDNVTEYINLLSLLDSSGDLIDIDVPKAESSDNLCKFKDRLSQYIACECKSSSSKFVEFWVPSVISNVQLEQYCDTLLSKSMSLCSVSKTDPVGALRDIVFSTRKSCDHPYIVDPLLKILITKDLPPINFLDVEIKASGKLQLLEMILTEIKKRQMRVLILFQSVAGSGRDKLGLGDILDDFLRERFGADTYERIDGGAMSSKSRQKALNNFNKGGERFVFLLENRACFPSIRLVSVDTVIIFDSDWNPANDVKALNKISIDSQFKQIKIFRLYSAFTVEEKVLILAKQGVTLESKLENTSRATSNMLLMWGASYLLSRLDEIHSTPESNVSSEHTLSSKVMDEILALLSEYGECDDIDNYSILKIRHRGGIYTSNQKLLGEKEVQSSDDEHPHKFWTTLLNGKNPKWKFLSGQTQRHRKKVQYNDDSFGKECEDVNVGKKRKKGGANCMDPANSNPGLEQDKAGGGASGILEEYNLCSVRRVNLHHPSDAPTIVSENSKLSDTQKSLHLRVKPDILKLCEILRLSDKVKIMAERFLEYVMSNHQVKSDSPSILQAFLISLCWNSASLLKQKVDRKESLFLAKQHLKFSCNEKEAESVYAAVRKLKKTFVENISSDLSQNSISGVEKFQKGTLNGKMMQLQSVKPELEEIRDQVQFVERAQDNETQKVDSENTLKQIQRRCRKRLAKLKQKQEKEIEDLNRYWEDQRVEVENKLRVESAVIREMYSNVAVRAEKLKTLDNECTMKLEEIQQQKDIMLKQLKEKQFIELSNENKKAAEWLEEARSVATAVADQDELHLHRSDVQNEVEYSHSGKDGSSNVSENDATLSMHPNVFAGDTNIIKMVPDKTCVTDQYRDVSFKSLANIVTTTENINSRTDEVETVVSVNGSVARIQQPNKLATPADVFGNTHSESQYHSESQTLNQILVGGSGEKVLPEQLQRIQEKVIADASPSELEVPEVDFHGENNRVGGVSTNTPNAYKSHSQSGKANSSVGVDSLSTVPEIQPDSSLQKHDADNVNQPKLDALLVEPIAHVGPVQREQLAASLSSCSPTNSPLASGSAPRLLNEGGTPPQSAQGFQSSENTTLFTGQAPLLTGQTVQENLVTGNSVLRQPPPKQPEILQQIEAPVLQNQPDLPSTSTVDRQQPVTFLQSEALPQVTGSTTELPRQAVVPAGASTSVIQGSNDIPLGAEHQVPSRIPKLTSYNDPLQNQLEGIRKETEETIKLYTDTKMRLDSELEEIIAQARRLYEGKHKDADAAFQWKKKELDKNHNKVLMNKILADAFRSKCVEPSRYTGMQHAVHPGLVQRLNQLPSHAAPRSSPASQHNTGSMAQPTSRLHPVVPSSTRQPAVNQQNMALPSSSSIHQPAANQQNMELPPQPGTRLPVSSSNSQTAAKQQHVTLVRQHEPGNTFVSVPSSVSQPAAGQQSTVPLLQPLPRIPPISVSSSTAQPVASQQSTQPPLQIVHQPAALFTSIPARPPQINPITPSMGNLRVGNENRARAPAPHLQAFRSASPVNLTSTQRVTPSHRTPSSLPMSSSDPSVPHAPSGPGSPAVPSNSTAVFGKPAQSNTALPPGPSTSTSVSASHQYGANRRAEDPPLPNLSSKLDSIDFSVFENGSSLPSSSAAADVKTSVVCLSDGD